MRGKYGVSMGGIEHRPPKVYCKQCEYCESKTTKNKFVFCKKRKKPMKRSVPHICKSYKKKWKDAKASEVRVYNIADLSEEERRKYGLQI